PGLPGGLAELERVAHEVPQVLALRLLVVVRQEDRVALLLEPEDLVLDLIWRRKLLRLAPVRPVDRQPARHVCLLTMDWMHAPFNPLAFPVAREQSSPETHSCGSRDRLRGAPPGRATPEPDPDHAGAGKRGIMKKNDIGRAHV